MPIDELVAAVLSMPAWVRKPAVGVVAPDADSLIVLSAYTNTVIVAGAILLALAVPQSMSVDPAWFAGLMALGIAASLFKVDLQLPGGGATMTLGYAVGFVGLLTIGEHPTALVQSAAIWTQCSYRTGRKTPLDLTRRLFSVACGAITVEVAGWTFGALGGAPGHLHSNILLLVKNFVFLCKRNRHAQKRLFKLQCDHRAVPNAFGNHYGRRN